jgi:hypothetical protein
MVFAQLLFDSPGKDRSD